MRAGSRDANPQAGYLTAPWSSTVESNHVPLAYQTSACTGRPVLGGGPGGARIPDALGFNQPLFRLSYRTVEPSHGVEPCCPGYRPGLLAGDDGMERAAGVEPALAGWKPAVRSR